MSRPELDHTEQLLRQNATRLCDEVAARWLKVPDRNIANISAEAAAQISAHNIHDLVLVVAALYPSDTTLRQQYEWAATGLLDRHRVDYEDHVILLRLYFEVARDILGPSEHPTLNRLEAFMKQVLTDVFWGPGDN